MPNERLKEDWDVVLPGDDIDCVDCRLRFPGKIGFRNGYCEAFPKERGGKPNGILFKGERCPEKQKE